RGYRHEVDTGNQQYAERNGTETVYVGNLAAWKPFLIAVATQMNVPDIHESHCGITTDIFTDTTIQKIRNSGLYRLNASPFSQQEIGIKIRISKFRACDLHHGRH